MPRAMEVSKHEDKASNAPSYPKFQPGQHVVAQDPKSKKWTKNEWKAERKEHAALLDEEKSVKLLKQAEKLEGVHIHVHHHHHKHLVKA